MTNRTCSEDGCATPHYARGFCKTHYGRVLAGEKPECVIDGCGRKGVCRGWCWTHYDRWRKNGDPNTLGPRGERGDIVKDPDERFWSKVEKTDTCWLWTGGTRGRGGYGCYVRDRRNWLAHRWSYTVHVGPIPEGKVIDHLCRNTSCVRPEHLEAVTLEENSRRASRSRDMSHCGRGHDMSGPAKRSRKDGTTYCGECANKAQSNRRARYRAVEKARAWVEENPESEGADIIAGLVGLLAKRN